MPRVPKKNIKSSGEAKKDDFFPIMFSVIIVAFLVGIDFIIEGKVIRPISSVSADMETAAGLTEGQITAPVLMEVENGNDETVSVFKFDPENPEPQCDFRSSRSAILYGQPVRLIWNCINADSCSITGGDEEIGAVKTSSSEGLEIIPRKSARYFMTCSSDEGSKTFDTSIGVFEFTIKEVPPPEE